MIVAVVNLCTLVDGVRIYVGHLRQLKTGSSFFGALKNTKISIARR